MVTGDSQNSRPPNGKLRRRSTLNWTDALLMTRQKRLEDVIAARMADTWFSLHRAENSDPFYISEVVEKAMNLSFRFFDLHTYGPCVTRSDKLTIKCWAKTEHMDDYKLLIEMQLNLGSLQFIGKTVRRISSIHQSCMPPLTTCLVGGLSAFSSSELHHFPFDRRYIYELHRSSPGSRCLS